MENKENCEDYRENERDEVVQYDHKEQWCRHLTKYYNNAPKVCY